MANLSAPGGFKPIRYMNGKPYNGAMTKYYTAGAAVLGVGDPVVRVAGGTASDPNGVASAIVRASTGSYITGVIVGFEVNADNLSESGARGTGDTNYYVYVADDPDLLFEVQEGGSGTVLTNATGIGKTINSVTALNADTVIGRSKYQLDNASIKADDTGTWLIVGLVQKADNANGTNQKWLVKANLHTEAVAGAANYLNI